ncbi:MAG: MFS transporter [Fimbriimonadaceae bacterium]|nr:MFS transporter [Fimbriimonadaceae bacterium]
MSAVPATSEKVTPEQRKAFIAAWLGWAFDGLDGFLYALVAVKFVTELMGPGTQPDVVAKYAGVIQAVFLFGWAFGGAFFGRIGDKIGRTKTLTITILTYALFTGFCALSQAWWHLLIFRFIAALGIGGEWAAGSALVSETLHDKHRSWASALLQSGYMTGMILAALTVRFMAELPVRWVFVIGVLPALLTVWIRKSIHEPKEWQEERKTREIPKVSALFQGAILKNTLLSLTFCGICLTTIWAFLFYSTPVLRSLPEVKAMDPSSATLLVSNVVIIFTLWNIVGNFAATYMAKLTSIRFTFAFFMAASFITFYVGFGQPRDLGGLTLYYNIVMFFGTGVFAIFPLYIPKLFPTLLRTTGSGFSYNFGRVIAGVGTLVLPLMLSRPDAPTPLNILWYTGFLYIAGFGVALLMPEVKAAMTSSPEFATE